MNIDFLKAPEDRSAPTLPPFRERVLLLILFFCVTLALMAPIASDTYLPKIKDYRNHSSLVVQAKLALEEGQFPIRVSPIEHLSLNYPTFQFYSPFMYTVAGTIYRWITPNNPYVALKYTMLLAFMLAGIYSYRCAYLLTQNKKIAMVAALVYMCTPYLLINLLARGAFTEVFAQGLIPVVLYYNVLATQPGAPHRTLVELSLAWAMLCLSHSITFVYTSFFMGLLFAGLAIYRIVSIKDLLKLACAYLFSCLLCLWMLAPAFDIQSITQIGIRSPYLYNWLTPLSSLFSFTAVSPMPLPGNTLLTTKIYVSLGLPMLIALGLALIRLFEVEAPTPSRRFFKTVLFVYAVAFLMAWAPFDVYAFLPSLLDIGQFSYRLLSQTSWIGIIILCMVISKAQVTESPHTGFYVTFIAIILLAAAPWINTQDDSGVKIEEILQDPESGYGKAGYSPLHSAIFSDINQDLIKEKTLSFIEKDHPFYKAADTLPFLGAPCVREGGSTVCELVSKGEAQLTPIPAIYYPKGLSISADGNPITYEPAMSGKFVIAAARMPKGVHKVIITYTGYTWANRISFMALMLALGALIICTSVDIRYALSRKSLC